MSDDFQGIAWIKGHDPSDPRSVTHYGYCAAAADDCASSDSGSPYFRNTGVVNLRLGASGGMLTDEAAANVFVHEVGHSLGAKHDDRIVRGRILAFEGFIQRHPYKQKKNLSKILDPKYEKFLSKVKPFF